MKLPDNAAGYVLIVGDVMLDLYVGASVTRISPEAPVPVCKLEPSHVISAPGGAANVACNVQAMGAEAFLIGTVGADSHAGILGNLLLSHRVNGFLARSEGPTTTKMRVMAGQGHTHQVVRLDTEAPPGQLAVDGVREGALGAIDNRDHPLRALVLADYAKGAVPDPQPIIRAANARGVPVLVDPKSPDWSIYSGASIIKPNLSEFLHAFDAASIDRVEFRNVREALKAMRIGAAVVTMGGDGALIVQADRDQAPVQVHGIKMTRGVADVAGAGDTTIAAMAAWTGFGLDIEALTRIGMQAASIAVGRVGTTTVTRRELEDA